LGLFINRVQETKKFRGFDLRVFSQKHMPHCQSPKGWTKCIKGGMNLKREKLPKTFPATKNAVCQN
jgi:hypothetical protein